MVDLQRRVLDPELLPEHPLELAAPLVAVLPLANEHVRRERRKARGDRPDVEIVDLDDSLGAHVTWPGLTSVRQPLEQVARELVELLHAVLSHKPVEQPGRMLEPTLVVRRSTVPTAPRPGTSAADAQ